MPYQTRLSRLNTAARSGTGQLRHEFLYTFKEVLDLYNKCSRPFNEETSASERIMGKPATAQITLLTDRIYKILTGETASNDQQFILTLHKAIVDKMLLGKIEKTVDKLVNDMGM